MKKIFLLSVILLNILFLSLAESSAENDLNPSRFEKAVLAGGCFWCVESDLEKVTGVAGVVSGYAGGNGANPTYKTYERMGYIEVVEVTYDPAVISYEQLLDEFFRKINPTDGGGQFCDRGKAYRPAVFYQDEAQRKIIEQSIEKLQKSGKFDKPFKTELIKEAPFYPAEDYHQDYYKKNSLKYKYYRTRCGRDQYLQKIWGKDAGH